MTALDIFQHDAETEMTPHLLEQAGVVSDGDQYPDSTALILDVDSIIVTDRYRKEIGDVSDLKASIANVGLLNPITVREWHGGHRLVAGERRLTAFRQMGLTEIPARLARDIADARDALVAERDENTARKPMLLSEATALGIAIEEMEKPAAKERQRFHGGTAPGITSVPGNTSDGRRTRDIAAEAVGMSGTSFTRMKTIVTVAGNEDESEEVREVAREAADAIDNGASIRQQYDKVAAARKASVKPSDSAPKRDADKAEYLLALGTLHPTMRIAFNLDANSRYASLESFAAAARTAGVTWRFTEKQWQSRVETSRDVLNRSSLGIEVALDAIDLRVDMQTITPEQATEVLERLNASALNRIIKQLKEISNG